MRPTPANGIKQLLIFLALLGSLLSFSGCVTSKSLSKKAAQLDEAGMYAEAANFYYQSLQKNARNIDAKIGLKKTGQRVLDDYLSDFFQAMATQDRAGAVRNYQQATDYKLKLERVGIILDIPDHYQRDYQRIKDEHVEDLYRQGVRQLEDEKFAAAEATFNRLLELKSDYRDARRLRDEAFMEPRYREANRLAEAESYRQAWNLLTQITDRDPGYKDAANLRDICLEKGAINVAILPFENHTRNQSIASRIQAYVSTNLTNVNDPFLKVVERENMDQILEEQKRILSGVLDESTASQVGQLIGAQYLLMGEVIDYRPVTGRRQRTTKDGFEAYTVTLRNDEGREYEATRYRPVKYNEYYQRNTVFLSVNYRLVSLRTGQVLKTTVLEKEVADETSFADYRGKAKNLIPALDGKLNNSWSAVSSLRRQLSANREVKDVNTLSTEAFKLVSNQVANEVSRELISLSR